MQIPILIEPVDQGFRARAGEPFSASAEGQTENEAAERLTDLLRKKLNSGARLAVVNVGNGSPVPFHLDALPDDDWFFRTMREEIAENRERENEANQ